MSIRVELVSSSHDTRICESFVNKYTTWCGLSSVLAAIPACLVTRLTKLLSLAVEEALLSMSVSQTCGEAYQQGEVRVDPDELYPLFGLDSVVEYMAALDRNDLISRETLFWAYPAFDENVIRFGSLSGTDNGVFDAVGLGRGVSPSALSLPLRCQAELLLWELLGYFIAALYYLGSWLVSFSFNHPYVSAVILATAKLTSIFQGKRRHRRRVNDLFEPVKEQAYDLLAESTTSEGYAALLLRDDVTHIMFSNNADREFINAYVWPKVVHDVRRDNRVHKFRKHHGGKELDGTLGTCSCFGLESKSQKVWLDTRACARKPVECD